MTADDINELVEQEWEAEARSLAALLSHESALKVAAMRALEPFAREADTWDFDVPDDHVVKVEVCGPGDTEDSQFTVGDLRRASAALAAAKPEGGGA